MMTLGTLGRARARRRLRACKSGLAIGPGSARAEFRTRRRRREREKKSRPLSLSLAGPLSLFPSPACGEGRVRVLFLVAPSPFPRGLSRARPSRAKALRGRSLTSPPPRLDATRKAPEGRPREEANLEKKRTTGRKKNQERLFLGCVFLRRIASTEVAVLLWLMNGLSVCVYLCLCVCVSAESSRKR